MDFEAMLNVDIIFGNIFLTTLINDLFDKIDIFDDSFDQTQSCKPGKCLERLS